ncbi:MAG TPA: hypothetical protein VKS78_10925 [Roseiarcus sp.]|nr:hypothetical protein [Roseiarcus sp.]
MTEYIKAWQCIGCGKIEAPQPCIGVCQDRQVLLVYALEHDELVESARRGEEGMAILKALARQLAFTTPRKGEWERCYGALQKEARRALSALARNEATKSAKRARANRSSV